MVSKPHDGKLVSRIVAQKTKEKIISEQKEYLVIKVNEGVAIGLENIAHGLYSPLSGFSIQSEFESVLASLQRCSMDHFHNLRC